MALSTTHPNYFRGSYLDEIAIFLKLTENRELYIGTLNNNQAQVQLSLAPHLDSAGPSAHVAIGYGYDLFVRETDEIINDLAGVGLSLSAEDIFLLDEYHFGIQSAAYVKANLSLVLPSEQVATDLMNLKIAEAEDLVTNRLNNLANTTIAQSRERAALVSLGYNGGSGALGNKLMNAIKMDNRAEAWYEIRYNTNKNALTLTNKGDRIILRNS